MKVCVALIAVLSTSTTVHAAPAGTWTNVTPAAISLTGNDNYGIQDVLVDPRHQNVLYAFTCRFGVWQSEDYGQTWKKVSGADSPLEKGKTWGEAMAPDGSYMLATSSDSRRVFRSTDGGVTWQASVETTVWPYDVDIDPDNVNHAITTGHGENHLIESMDGGRTWDDQGPMGNTTGSSYINFLLDSNTVLAVSGDNPKAGAWRGVKADGKWTWTRVSDQEHDHGSHQLFIDRQRKIIYNPGAAPGLGIQKSVDNGLTWASVAHDAADSIVATPTRFYAARSFPVQSRYDPYLRHAPRDQDTAWVHDPTPPGMENGPKRMAVTFDGHNYIIVSGNWCGGLWRYVEPAQGGGKD